MIFCTLLRFDHVVQNVSPAGMTQDSLQLLSPGGVLVTLVHDLERSTSDLGAGAGYLMALYRRLRIDLPQVSV